MATLKSVCLVVQNIYDLDVRIRRKAESLVAEGYIVDVIALRPMSTNVSTYDLDGVKVHTVPLRKKRGSILRYAYEYLAFFVSVFFKVALLMLQRRYKVIDVSTLPDFLVFATLIPKWMGTKIVLDMHEVMPEFYMSKYGVGENSLIIRLIKWQEKLSMHFAEHVLTINEPIQKLLESRGLSPRKSTIVMNSVNEKLFDYEKLKDKDRGNANFILMYHGTLTHIYGVDIALQAFAMAQNQMKRAEFWIVGDGPERVKLEILVDRLMLSGKVKFIGQVAYEEIPKLLNQCSVGVMATRQDIFLELSFSNKLPEYIIAGKPVIASRIKTIRHYFSDKSLAYFEPGNVSDLTARMVEVYKSPKLREELVKQAQCEYAPINWSTMKRRYLDLINSLTTRNEVTPRSKPRRIRP